MNAKSNNPLSPSPRDTGANSPALASVGHAVGIGASAGGLEALRPLIARLSPTGRTVYFLALHQLADQPSALTELLAHDARLAVRTAVDGQPVAPDRVWVIPPGWDLTVRGECIRLAAPPADAHSPSIDRLFVSLAESYGDRAVGVLLSGTGHDGTEGGKAIHAAGGRVIVQRPASAQYADLPAAAIQAGIVERQLDIAEIADYLNALDEAPVVPAPPATESSSPDTATLFQELLQRVLEATRMDATHYKEGTLRRQIERRMAALRLPSLEDYLGFVRVNPDEIRLLQQSFIISVTDFFRDPSVFGLLRRAIAGLVAAKQPGDAIRAWVPGSATGEEAYSIAIVLADVLGERLAQFDVRVLATDLDPNAIQTARAGVYPRSALENLDADLRERYFVSQGRALRVGRAIRERCVFASHDLVHQPPFLGLDLISCRNVLIYFQPGLQDEMLARFHYALNRDGLLLLGQSETASAASTLFEPLDGQYRLYRRRNVPTPRLHFSPHSALPSRAQQSSSPGSVERASSPESAMRECLLREYAPASVLVNRDGLPLHFFGKVERYLNIPRGAADFSLLALCRPELRGEIRTLLHLVSRERRTSAAGRSQPLALEDGAARVRMVARRVDLDLTGNDGAILISFEEQPAPLEMGAADPGQPLREQSPDEIDELRQELAATREHLGAVIEEMETSNEKLQSLNEELQVSSEELQVSNEELQSTNEELITLNDELSAKSAELTDTNDALTNILDSIQAGLVVVDGQGKVRRFNPLAVRVFGLMPEDVGQRLCGVPCTLDLPGLHGQIEEVIRSGAPVIQRASQENRHYLMQISPYVESSGQRTGAVLTFADISELRRAEIEREQAEMSYRFLFDNMLNGFAYCRMLYDQGQPRDFVYLNVNAAFGALTGLKEVVGKKVTEVIPGIRESDAELFEIYGRVALSGQPERFERYVEALRQWFWVSVYSPSKEHFVAVFDVVTERKQAEEALRESERRYRELVENANSAIIRWSRDGAITFFNEYAQAFFGWPADEAIGQHVGILVPERESTGADLTALVRDIVDHPDRYVNNVNENICRDGRRVWMNWTNRPIFDERGQVTEILAIGSDITERKQAEEALELAHNRLAEAQKIAHLGSFEYVAATRTTVWSEEEYRIYGLDPAGPSPAYDVMLAQCIHPDDAALLHETFTEAMQGGAIYELEHRIVRPDGSVRWVYDRAHPYFDEKGDLLRYVGATLDITERKQAEEALRESEWQYRLLAENATEGIFWLDPNGSFKYVSPAFGNLFGYPPEQFLADPTLMVRILHPEDQIAYQVHFEQLAVLDEEEFEFRLTRRDGEVRWISHQCQPIFDEAGHYLGRRGIHRDITERKRVAAELEQYRHHLEELVAHRTAELQDANRIVAERAAEIADLYNNAPCGYHSLDATGTFIAINDTELAMLGYAREEVVGRLRADQVMTPASRLVFEENFPRFKQTGHVHGLEFDMVRKDGSLLPVVLSATAVCDDQGRYLFSRSTLFDNRERKEREQRIAALNMELERRADEADAANRAKSTFLANMSH
ncbi:MAG: PAS domain S-box protein, partial [Candidatus Competibacter sp.]|nr:PAS domain S-box protein [Candidatus Competibacter sp.]